MKRQNTLISIGMPIYNGEPFLEKAVRSILAQDYPHLEIIISNDNSTDNSLKILQKLAAKDKRIRLFNQTTNLGLAANYNFVLKQAKGTYFMWAAQDDLREKQTVSTLYNLLLNKSNAVLVASNFKNVYKNKTYFPYKKMDYDNKISHLDSVKKYLEYDQISFLFGMYKTAILKKTGGHHADFRPYFKSSDFLTVLKPLMYGPFVYTHEVLFFKQDTGYFTNQFEVIKQHNFNFEIMNRIARYLFSPFFYFLDLLFGTLIIWSSGFTFLQKIELAFVLLKNIWHKCWLFISNIFKGAFIFFKSLTQK